MGDSARSGAANADKAVNDGRPLGRLHGVPIAVKDLYATKGVRTTFACAAFADWVPDYDASVVERMMEAGAIIVGKLNLHEAASGTGSQAQAPPVPVVDRSDGGARGAARNGGGARRTCRARERVLRLHDGRSRQGRQDERRQRLRNPQAGPGFARSRRPRGLSAGAKRLDPAEENHGGVFLCNESTRLNRFARPAPANKKYGRDHGLDLS